MRAVPLAALVFLVVVAGCGGTAHTTRTTETTKTTATHVAAAKRREDRSGLRIGLVGPVRIDVPGAVGEPGTLEQAGGDALVVVSAAKASLAEVVAAADAHPTSHYAIVGASSKGSRRRNVVGLVLDDAQAALLGGVVAGLVAGDQGGQDARVAWVGPEERKLAGAFARGTHTVLPGTTVLRAWSRDDPASCKEAALGAIDRGAVAVMAHGGTCAEAAIAAAHEQNLVGLSMSDFEFPDVPAEAAAREAVAGVYRGNEDLVFGASSAAVGIRRLDPRIPPDLALRARTAAQQLASGRRPSGVVG